MNRFALPGLGVLLVFAAACQKPETPQAPTTPPPLTEAPPPTAVPAPEDQVDHFKIWKVAKVAFNRQVMLKSQFDKTADGEEKPPWPAHIESLEYIANPVMKNDRPRLDPNTHLLAYFLKQSEKPGPRRWVTLSNQFGPSRWRLTDPVFLLVPAGKKFDSDPPPPAGRLDHFLCYLVRQTQAVDKPLTLVDQFDEKRNAVERITKVEPAFFCVPVAKDAKPINNPNVHLAVYDITPTTRLKDAITVRTLDQFPPARTLTVTESILLAVPSQKTDFGPDDDGDDPS